MNKLKELGLKVKLDTNGTNPSLMYELINKKLIDYVSMDIKILRININPLPEIKDISMDKIEECILLISMLLIMNFGQP